MNIVINRKNMMKLQNSMYQNKDQAMRISNKMNDRNKNEVSYERKKYNLSPSEFQSEQEMMLLEQRKQKLIDKQNEY